MQRILWLSKTVLSWETGFDMGHRSDVERVNRPHELLAHSERQLSSGQDVFIRADAVLNLKRAINSRLQHLEELYAFSTAFPKSVGALERLQVVGLAMPLLIRQLFALRNDIEHNDIAPPDEPKCRELMDSTWYFLKTTDYACKLVPHGVALRNPETPIDAGSPESITIRVTASSAEVELHGRLSRETLSSIERSGFFPVREENMGVGELTKAYVLAREGARVGPNPAADRYQLFFGRATAPPEVRHALWKLMLETL